MHYKKFNKFQAEIKRIYILAICLFGFSFSVVGQIDTTFSRTDFRGDFIMIGNVNHELDSANLSKDTIEIKSPLRPIQKVAGYNNSNTATFNLGITEPCEDDGVVFANLSWMGKIPSTGFTDYEKVEFQIDGVTNFQTIESEKTEIITNSFNNDYNGIYVCHKNITGLFKNLDLNKEYTATVANIATKLDNDLTKFSGWTLTIIYKQKTKDPINISYYRPDIIVESGGNGRPATDINQNFDLGYTFNGVGDITIGASFACGTNMEDDENLFIGDTKTITELSTISKSARSKRPQLIVSEGRPDGNFLCNKINGRSNPGNANTNSKGYSRGFDLEVTTLNNKDSAYLSRKATEISVLLDGCAEHHLFADFLVATGVPKVPEIETVLDAEPKDSSVKIVANVNTRNNVEDLNNFNLSIKLPDYTKKISDFKISGKLIDNYVPNGTKENNITIKETNKDVCKYTITKIKNGAAKFSDDFNKLNPTASTRQTLNVSYDGIIPSDLSADKILTIEFIAHVNPEMYARKGALLGSESNESIQAELGVSGNDSHIPNYIYSNPYSVLSDSLTEPCYDFGGFGGGNGFGSFGGGGGGGGGGSNGRNGQPSEISFDFEFGCSNLPDTITIDGCENECFPVERIKEILIREYQFDIDSLAKIDSLAWIEIKRDSLIELFTLSIENKIRLDSDKYLMYSDSSNWYSMKDFWTKLGDLSEYKTKDNDTLKNYLKNHCFITERELVVLYSKADDIINRKVEVTHLDYRLDENKWERDNGNGGKDTCIPFIEDDATYSIIFATPYKNRDSKSLCNDTLIIKAHKEVVPLIGLLDGNTSINNKGKIQYCKEENLGLLTIKRKKKNYKVEVIDDKYSSFTLTSDSTYEFIPDIDTSLPGEDSVKFIQRNNTGCISDTFTLYIEVLDVTASETPDIPSAINRCVTPNETVIITIEDLEAVKEKRAEGFDVRWYSVINNKDSIIAEDTISIEVPIDSAGTFTYGAKFYFFGCESEMATTTLNIRPEGGKINPAIVSGCQYSTPEEDRIKIALGTKGMDSVYYFQYDATNPSPTFEETDSVGISRIINSIDFNQHGKNYFYVRRKNVYGCWSDTTLMTIDVKQTDSIRTQFANKVDSVLYCVGDEVKTIDGFIEKSGYLDPSFEWRWYNKEPKLPYNVFPPNTIPSGTSITINSSMPSTNEYYVVRIDSNNCASNPAKFRVRVDDKITDLPMVGDTSNMNFNNLITLDFCKGVSKYDRNILPMKSSITNYTIEWIEKTNITENSDSLLTQTANPPSLKSNKKDVILVNVNSVKKYYYSVRQSTQLGCKGPWANVVLTINDSVREIPKATPIIACQFDDTLLEVRNSINNNFSKDLILNYYDNKKNPIDEAEAIVPTDIAGNFLQSNKQNKFYVSLTNSSTSCEGKIVGIDATINPKPGLPLIADENKNLLFCTDNELITINDFAKASINTAESNTKLLWSNETILTNKDRYDSVNVRQIDTTTQCLGDDIKIDITIEKTFEFTPIDSITVCYNMHVDLWNTIEKNIHTNKQPLIKDAKPEFAIYPIIGNIQQPKLSQTEAQNIKSEVLPTQDQVRDFLVEIWEPKSRCIVTDSIHIRFKALPTLNKLENKTFCQYEEFDLPTPSSDYRYEWKNLDGTILKTWNNISLTDDNTFRLIATTKDDYQCQDSIDWSVKIVEIPEKPIVFDTSFCQNTGRHNIDYKLQSTISNPESDLNLRWFKNGEAIDFVNTDTLFTSNIIQETYTAVVTNINTQCFNSSDITVSTLQKISLNMEDIAPVCEPETINVANKISDYIKNAHLFGGNTPRLSSCFIIENGVEKQMNINDLSAIEFDVNNIEREFGYKMRDSKGVCTSSDTFKVTINPKPSIPTIEGGQDTLFYCIDDAPFSLTAQPNGILKDVGLFWDNGVKGNVTPINEGNRTATYSVQAIDTITQCSGEFTNIVAAIAPAIETEPIDGKDTIELCTGESINLWDLAYSSFSHSGFDRSELIITSSTKNGNGIGQALLENITSTQQDTSLYQFEITDPLTGCVGRNQVVVIFHENPNIKIDGATTICQNLNLDLNTVGDDRLINYEWKVDNSLVSTQKVYQKENLQQNFMIRLTTTLDELKSCSTVIEKEIVVNPAPTEELDSVFNICQTATEKSVKVNLGRGSNDIAQYSITWFNKDGSVFSQNEDIEIELSQNKVLEYQVMLTNRSTSCEGGKDNVTIKINPRINIAWTDPDTICPPNEYALLENVWNSVSGGTHPKYQYTLLNGDTVRDENNIAQSGLYTVYFTDDNQCDASQEVKIQFFKQPEIPTLVGEDIVCQSTGDVTFTAKKNGEDVLNQTFEWKEGNQTALSDQLSVSTEEYGIRNFILTAVDTLSQCRSEEFAFKLDIREKIKFSPIEPLESCFDVPVDLTQATQNAYSGNEEEKILTYFTLNSNNSLSLINDPTQVLNSGKIIIKANETESGCEREDTIVVDIKKPLEIGAEGTTVICQGDEIKDLTAINADRFTWVRKDGSKIESTLFPFGNSVTGTETFRLYGEKKVGNIFCEDSTDIEIMVNINPSPLNDTAIAFCQSYSDKSVDINMNRSEENINQYSITWFDKDGDVHSTEENISIDLNEAKKLSFQVMTTNKTTSCKSEKSDVVVTINPRINIAWTDPDTICPPNEYALLENVWNSVSGGTHPKYQYTLLNGDTVRDENNIAQSGLYTVYFTDDNQCDASQEVKIQFFKQPEIPTLVGEDIVCQSTGDVTFTAKKNGEDFLNQTFEWKEGNQTTLSDQLSVSTEQYGMRNFILTAVDTLSQCRSEEVPFKLDIREKIGYTLLDTLESCYNVEVDLVEATNGAYFGSDEEKILTFFTLNSNNSSSLISDPTQVLSGGSIIIKAKENESGCEREDTIVVDIKKPLGIGAEGTTMICQGDEINELTAINADRFTWVRKDGSKIESTLFPFGNSVTETETFRLYGEKKVGNIFCEDSTDIEITVNPNPMRLADSSLVYCQTINGQEELNFLTNKREGENLGIKWLTENDTELFSENELPSINTSNDTVYAIYAKQINSTTGCESELATITINILPQIEVPTIDSTTCQPNIINLEKLGRIGVSAKEYSKDIIIESIGVTNETDRSIVTTIDDGTQISESGIYRIFYNYTLGDVTCRNTTDAKLTFLQQPQKPSIANQVFCQNTGDVELAGVPSYSNLRLIWEDLSVYPSRIDTNTTTITTELATEMNIKVRHIQDNSGCISEDTVIRVKIFPELIAMDLDTSICYGESVNLREMVKNNHRNNPLINDIQFKNLDAMQFDEKKVENTSLYEAYFSDASGVCRDTSLVQINVNNPIEITLEGDNPSICAQEVIQISATGADGYKWNDTNEGATFTLKTTTPQKMQINLRAKQAFKEIFCYKDSTISIEVMPAVEPLILTYDTCSKSKITTDLIKSKFNISENIDSIWYYNSAIKRDNINKVLEDEGNYQLLATNQYGCKAIHNMKVNMYNVGKLAIENDNSKIYCYNDTITFKATSENESKFTWKNSDNDSILYQGNNYWDSLKANTNLTLIASEVVMGCKDSISFTVNVREQTPIIVSVTSKKGETNVCKGDTIKLAVEGINSVSWLYNDSIIESNNLEIIGEKTTNIYAWGRDINNCQTNTEKVEINVASLSNPIIKTINSSGEYDLSKEKTNIELYADGNTNNGLITYQWQIGNEIMSSSTGNSFSHTFSDETIHLNKDIEVNLYLEHEYGCKASASRILTIDPYLYVPNTLLYGHGIIFMEDYDLQIYDRVGTLIHEGKGWDGTYKGRPAIADTYFYSLLYYIKGEKQFKTGYITLVR